jgi:predicted transposase YbfD/YdcC
LPVSHACHDARYDSCEIPGLLQVLARVPDPRKRRGRRFSLVFVLAVAVVAVLAGATNFREIGDQAADLSQRLLEHLGGRRHPLKGAIATPSEKRIRTLIQQIDATMLDRVVGGWLWDLAQAGRLEPLVRALAVDGKHLRGTDGVVLFSAMLHHERVVVAQRQVPEGTNEITQVKDLLDPLDLDGIVVTGDAAHTQHDTAEYIAGDRDAGYFLTVKGNQPGLQAAIFDKIQADRGPAADHVTVQEGHGRIVERSLWVTDADGIEFPHAAQVARIRRDVYDLAGRRISKEIVHAVTSLGTGLATPGDLAALAQGQWGIESIHWIRDAVYREDDNRAYTGQGPQIMATLRNLAVSLLHLGGITKIKATLQQIGRDRDRVLAVLPL